MLFECRRFRVCYAFILVFVFTSLAVAQQSLTEQKQREQWDKLIPEIKAELVRTHYVCDYDHWEPTVSAIADITGDGVSEALVPWCVGGAYTTSLVLFRLESGRPVMARFHMKDGTIGFAEFLSGSSAMHGAEVRLDPKWKAIYDIRSDFLEWDDRLSQVIKENTAVSAYVWNAATKTFDWNAWLSAETARGGHPWHQADTQTYSSMKYGISLRYPRSYRIKEGDISATDLGFMGTVEPQFTSSDSTRIMTVIMPSDLYPNTNFGVAFVTASIHQQLNPSQCRKFRNTLVLRKRIVRVISGKRFRGFEESEASAGGKGILANYYHGYSHGLCYEFGLVLATGTSGKTDDRRIYRVNEQTVFADLDRIVQSIVLSQPARDQKH